MGPLQREQNSRSRRSRAEVLAPYLAAISTSARAQGFVRRVLAFAEAEAVRRGYREIRLYTHQAMPERLHTSTGL
jgi:hypothetical protein